MAFSVNNFNVHCNCNYLHNRKSHICKYLEEEEEENASKPSVASEHYWYSSYCCYKLLPSQRHTVQVLLRWNENWGLSQWRDHYTFNRQRKNALFRLLGLPPNYMKHLTGQVTTSLSTEWGGPTGWSWFSLELMNHRQACIKLTIAPVWSAT